ncbi:MAG: DUF362 domain-containing protein [Candidatus Zixiibacteriota bacterium]|nr:MAG: DUF362 domain-containing protein [candidate division Zixibacteria bacterium]
MNEASFPLNRRDFLRLGATAAAGCALAPLWRPRLLWAGRDDTSRVVVVRDDSVLSGSAIDPAVTRIMVDAGLLVLTGAASVSDAWLALLPDLAPDAQVGLKINTINSLLSTHPEISLAVAGSLASATVGGETFPPNQIFIWDRWEWELLAAGYTINTSTAGVRCFGTDHEGIGYDDSHPLEVAGTTQLPSRAYGDHSDYLVNLCLLKNHVWAGATHALKNHYGTVDNPGALHGNYCDPAAPAVNAALIGAFGVRQRLCVCDAMFGIRYGGPMGAPQFLYRGLVLATDPVAFDVICRDILQENGCTTTYLAHHIETAAAAPYNLGICNPADIERVDVVNPSLGAGPGPEPAAPGGLVLGKNYPEPFNASTTIPVELDHPAQVTLDLYDALGRRVRELYRGGLSAGRHDFTWDGRAGGGREAGSGRYFARLTAAGQTHSRVMTLVR